MQQLTGIPRFVDGDAWFKINQIKKSQQRQPNANDFFAACFYSTACFYRACLFSLLLIVCQPLFHLPYCSFCCLTVLFF
jgi:hypothetical protein